MRSIQSIVCYSQAAIATVESNQADSNDFAIGDLNPMSYLSLRDRWRIWLSIRCTVTQPSCRYRVVTITEAPVGEFRRGPKQHLEIQAIAETPKGNR
ncbi:MAG: hypothetical protein AAFW84_00580 [Cyanobacteria bacterium J06635_15]